MSFGISKRTYIGLAIGETSFRPAPAERHESSALRSQRSARRSGGAYKRISRNGRRDFLARARTELLADDAVRDLQEFLLGPRWDRGSRRRVVAASESTDGLARLLHDRGEVEPPSDEIARRPRADLDPVVGRREGDDRQVLRRSFAVQGQARRDPDDCVADPVGRMKILDRVHRVDAGLRDRVHRLDQIFPMATQEPQRLTQELLTVAAADAVADLRLVVAAAGIHERPELLRVPRRASRGFPD